MTAIKKLGTFKKVDIKEIWPTEDKNFTPWLFQNENMALLSEALGLELESQQQEARVGTFRLDVLASEAGQDHSVAIENQFGPTDHRHLGQLITYAAGYDAKVVVWIAERFREEHRAALDMLNNTGTDTKFFGVRIEAWTIDDSLPAPRFDVVAAPNIWVKKARTPRDNQYMGFFQPLVDTLRNDHNFTIRTNATGNSAESFSASHPGLSYKSSFIAPRGSRHRVELFIERGDKALNEETFDKLRAQRQDIEFALDKSHTWDWQQTTEGRACRIAIVGEGGIDDEAMHDEIRKWMIDHLLKFREVFGPRLAELAEQGILDRR